MTTRACRINRRTALKGAAASLVLVAGGGVWRAADRGVFSAGRGPAYEPWTTWRTDRAEGPLELVRAAILAANPHDAQPWLFRTTDESVDVYADRRRTVGTVDPFLREMYIGVGCALENLCLAAATGGYRAEVALMPSQSDPGHAARVMLAQAPPVASPLYEAIPHRHTNRCAYDMARPIPPAALEALRELGTDPDVSVRWFADPDGRRRVGDLTVEATQAFNADAEQSHDSHAWFRDAWSDVQRHRDGVTIDASSLGPALTAAGKMLPPLSAEETGGYWLNSTRQTHVATASAFGLLLVRDSRDNAQRLAGGRLWQRMHLWATSQGIAMQPLNQLCGRDDREQQLGIEPRFGDALKGLIGDPSWQALMPFRVGYPTVAAPASPRRAVEDVLI